LLVTVAPVIVSNVLGAIVQDRLALLVPNALTAVIVAVPLPAVVGTPLISPLEEDISRPVGRFVALKLIGSVPLAVTA